MPEGDVFNRSTTEVDDASRDSDEVTVDTTEDAAPRRRTGLIVGISLITIAVIAAVVISLIFLVNRGSNSELPDGFPSQSELPLAEGEFLETADLAGSQASVTVEVESHDAQLAAVEQLLESGFSVIGQSGSGPVGTVTSLTSDSVAVRVEFSQTEDGVFTVNYVAAPIAEGQSSQ